MAGDGQAHDSMGWNLLVTMATQFQYEHSTNHKLRITNEYMQILVCWYVVTMTTVTA